MRLPKWRYSSCKLRTSYNLVGTARAIDSVGGLVSGATTRSAASPSVASLSTRQHGGLFR